MRDGRLADRLTHRITRWLHRIYSGVPVAKRWPGIAPVRAGLYRRLVQPGSNAVLWRLAVLHRSRLTDTVFIGVTGSAGKTMTKLLVSTVLSTRFRGSATRGSWNSVRAATLSLLRNVRRGDQYHVVELSAGKPGDIARQVRLVRPRIGIITNVGSDHYSAYGSIDALAAEKGRLARSLPSDGVAVLNADDPRVLPMRGGHTGRVITFGQSSDAMVRASDVSCVWPDRLSFAVTYEGHVVRVQTRLLGVHWVSAALAAFATGIALGVPLEAAAEAIGRIEPIDGRMSPVSLPDGVTWIRDDWKASVHTIPPALEFLRQARATRRIAILGTVSDAMGDAGRSYRKTARLALDSADIVCFVGHRASAALRATPTDRPERLRAFGTAKAASAFLSSVLQPGDLVLLKGSNTADHLYRLVLTRMSTVACWRMDCKRQLFCNTCDLVGVSSDAGKAVEDSAPPLRPDDDVAPVTVTTGTEAATMPQILIGLGNPGEEYRETPHNVGHAMLDRLAGELGATWSSEPDATIARAEWQGRSIWLVKPNSWINHSGRALQQLSERTGFAPEQCILVYDDLDLPFGSVRTRMRGSDGGHRGVRSILEAFQTDQFRRVKIGVNRPDDAGSARDAVLKAFSPAEKAVIDSTLQQAQRQLGELLARGVSAPIR